MKGIIFDCDGVILDSESLFAKGSNDHLKALGIIQDPDYDDNDAGITLKAYCEKIIKYYHIDQTLEEFLADEQKYLDKYFKDDELSPIEGLVDFLSKAFESGFKMGIASSSSKEYVKHKLKLFGIDKYFDFIVSGDMVTHSKPHPEIYLKAIEKMGLPANELLAIEDSVSGIRSAKDAGLYVIGLKASVIVQDTSNADLEVYSYKDIDLDALKALKR